MPVAAAVAVAVAGGIAGSEQDVANQTSSSSGSQVRTAAPATAEEKKARELQLNSMNDLETQLRKLESPEVMANLEKLMKELGQAPSATRIAEANQFAQDVYNPQRVALAQSQDQQRLQFANTAAQMGRSSADPILAAKLAQEQVRQQARLSSEQSAFAAQESINAPNRQFSNQLGGMMNLSQLAMQNRGAVFSMGSEFANSLQSYRLALATTEQSQMGKGETRSGGGMKGFMQGFTGGGAAGAKMFMGGGGGGS